MATCGGFMITSTQQLLAAEKKKRLLVESGNKDAAASIELLEAEISEYHRKSIGPFSSFYRLILKIKEINKSSCKDRKNGIKQLKIDQVMSMHESIKNNYFILFICPSL